MALVGRDAPLLRSTEKVQSAHGVIGVFVRSDVRVDGVEQLCEQDLAEQLRVHRRHAARISCVERLELRAGVLLAQRDARVVGLDPRAQVFFERRVRSHGRSKGRSPGRCEGHSQGRSVELPLLRGALNFNARDEREERGDGRASSCVMTKNSRLASARRGARGAWIARSVPKASPVKSPVIFIRACIFSG